jgi:hypothetical protein
MKRRYTFDDAQKGIKGTPVVLTEADFERALALLRLNPFSDSSTAQIDPASLPADALSLGQDVPAVPQP